MRPPDFVDVVEAAYISHAPYAWLSHVVRALEPLLDRGSGVLGYGFDATNADAILLETPHFAGAGQEVWSAMQRSTEGLEPRAVQRTYLGSRPFGSVAQRFVGSSRGIFAELARQNYAPNGFGDLLVLHIVDADQRGCLFAAPLQRSVAASRKEVTLWSRVAAHLRAGYRASLRQAQSDATEAVFTPSGRLLHAQGDATGANAREALRQAALAAERARCGRTRANPEGALELWPALVAGRWTLVEHFDADRRRLLLARRNEPDVEQHVRLTNRERAIAEQVLRGHSNKHIAHDLRVSEATVCEQLKNILTKLNLRSVGELREVLRQE